MPEFSLDTIAEVSVTLAGFSGLAAAFRTRPMRDWAEWERIWFWYIVTWSLGSLLFSLLPGVLGSLGVGPPVGWTLCAVFLALFITAAVGLGARRSWRLYRLGVLHPGSGIVSAAPLSLLGAAALLFLSLFGVGPPISGAYHLALFVTLGWACGSFFLFLQYPLSE